MLRPRPPPGMLTSTMIRFDALPKPLHGRLLRRSMARKRLMWSRWRADPLSPWSGTDHPFSLFMRPRESRVHPMQLGLVFRTQVERSKHDVDSLDRSGERELRLVRVSDG